MMEKIEEIGDVEKLYEVLHQVGDGGQADLHLGRERASNRKVALKIQKPWGHESMMYFTEIGKALAKEGSRTRILAGIPQVPDLIATGHYRNRRCLVLEFVEGKLLHDVLTSARPVRDPSTVASVIGQLCEILHAVHRKRLVHCDLKPENVMVEPTGRIRLIDMGFAIRMRTPTEWSRGTIGYMPPEQFDRSPFGLTRQADIFALGCMLLEMTVMRLPYAGSEGRPALGCSVPVLPPDRLAALPVEFAPLALRMVEREAAHRPAHVREVFAALRPYMPAPGSRRPLKPLRPDPTEYYRTHPPTL
ncbi:serine/threonine protein kinase [Streptomyces sp. NPDC018045]|uniref:serine/threonine protein kinase n=1 Tax=Streptomyces sp. NPDC018045 TaxID=3365037 RepID=UPI00379D3A17